MPRHGHQAELAFKARTYGAQLVSVDTARGTARVRVEGMHAEHTRVPLPMAISVKGFESSWVRYMPDDGAFGEVAYNAAGTPRLVALTPASYEQTTALAAARTGGMQVFRPLAKGEFDARSKGGAGYKGDQYGRLTLFAGAVNVTLDKSRREALVREAVHVSVGGDGTELRLGHVRRSTGGVAEQDVDGTASGTPLFTGDAAVPLTVPRREWRVRVGRKLDPTGVAGFASALWPALYEEWAGDLRDETPLVGAQVRSTATALPLRYRKRVYDDTGVVAVVDAEVDHLGNARLVQDPRAVLGGLTLAGPAAGPLSASYGAVAVEALAVDGAVAGKTVALNLAALTGSARLGAAVNVDVDATTGLIRLGGAAAVDPVPKGLTLYALLLGVADAITAIAAGPSTQGGTVSGPALRTAIEAARETLLSKKVLLV